MNVARGYLSKVASISVGTSVGALIAALSSPVLTRVYSPEAFGVLGIALAVTSVAVAAAAGKFDAAIPLEQTQSGAAGTLGAGAVSSICSGLIAVALLLGAPASILEDRDLSVSIMLMLPVIVMTAGLTQVGLGVAVRADMFRLVAAVRAVGPAVAVASQILLGSIWPTGDALVLGQMIGMIAAALLIWHRVARGQAFPRLGWIKAAMRRHWKMPTFVASSNLLTMASLNAPMVVLGLNFSLAAAGVYAITYRVMTAPALLLGQAIGQVFYARVARTPEKSERQRLVATTSGALADVSMVVFSWGFLFAPRAFELIFGDQWRGSGEYARLLIPWLAVGFVASPLSQFAMVCGKQGTMLKISLAEVVTRGISILSGVTVGSPQFLVASFGLAGTLIASAYVAWILALAEVDLKRWLNARVPFAALGAITVSLACIEGRLDLRLYWWFAVALIFVVSAIRIRKRIVDARLF